MLWLIRHIFINIYVSSIMSPVYTGRKLNVHKTFGRRPGRLLNVLRTFNLRPVSTGSSQIQVIPVASDQSIFFQHPILNPLKSIWKPKFFWCFQGRKWGGEGQNVTLERSRLSTNLRSEFWKIELWSNNLNTRKLNWFFSKFLMW